MPALLELTRSTARTGTALNGKVLSSEDYRDAYLFGTNSRLHQQGTFEEVEEKLHEIWDDLLGPTILEWSDVKHVVCSAYTVSR